MKKLIVVCSALLAVVFAVANEGGAPKPLEIVPNDRCNIGLLKWHEKDGGWLITCRLDVGAKSLIKPVAYLELRGYEPEAEPDEGEKTDEAEVEIEPVWVQRKVVFRKDFDKKVGSRDGIFVRFIIDEKVPDEVDRLEFEFVNDPLPKD